MRNKNNIVTTVTTHCDHLTTKYCLFRKTNQTEANIIITHSCDVT